jgi:hypothetical protein
LFGLGEGVSKGRWGGEVGQGSCGWPTFPYLVNCDGAEVYGLSVGT